MRTSASTRTTALAASLSVLAALAATIAPAPALAAESYDSCKGFIDSLPAAIGTQGTWCLRKDLGTGIASGNAIMVSTNNVTIDCNGFKLGGIAAGAGTNAYGIRAEGRVNINVRHCNVRGFRAGIYLTGTSGGGHIVEDNRLDGNTWVGISVTGDGSVIRRNQVRDTGGSTLGNVAYGIFALFNVDVLDNIIDGVLPAPSSQGYSQPYGIGTSQNSGGRIHGNSIRGLVALGIFEPRGIDNQSSLRIHLRDNDLSGDGSGTGLHCDSNLGTAKDNIVNGFGTGISGCSNSGGNVVK